MTLSGIQVLKTYAILSLLILALPQLTVAQGEETQLRIPLRQIVISADFDALGRSITQEKLLAIAQQKRRSLPEYVSYTNLLEIKDTLTRYMRSQGYKFHIASLPAQKLSRGYVSFSITTVTLDEVNINNTSKVKNKTITKGFEALLKKPLYQPDIDTALAPLRANPYLKVFAYYSRGRAENSVRLNINAESKRELELTTSLDNYGTKTIGEQRLLIQAQLKNPSLAMDKLNLTLLLFNGDELNTYGQLSYLRPVWGIDNRIRLSASNNVFQLGDSLATLELDGDASIFNLSFEHDFSAVASHNNTLSVSQEQRETTYSGFLQGELNERSSLTKLKWKFSRSHNPMLRQYTSISFALGDVEQGQQEKRDFNRTRLNYLAIITPKNWVSSKFASQFSIDIRSQFTSEKVSSFDQFSLTGITAVRAINPGQFSVDNGHLIKAEWQLPRLFSFHKNTWRIVPFTNIDLAQGEKLDEQGEELESGNLTGLAVGAMLNHKSGFFSKLTLTSAHKKEVNIGETNSEDGYTRELETAGALFEMRYRW